MTRTRLLLAVLGSTGLFVPPAGAFSMGEVGAATAVHGTLAGTSAPSASATLGVVQRNLPAVQTPTLTGLGEANIARPTATGGRGTPAHTPAHSSGSGRQGWASGEEGWKASKGGGTRAWATAASFGESGATKAWLTASSAGHATSTGKGWAQGGAGR